MKHELLSLVVVFTLSFISWDALSEETPFVAKITSGPCQSKHSQMRGSGTLFNYNGAVYFLTSEHVVFHSKKSTFCHIVSNSLVGAVKSDLLFADWGTGLALLKLNINTNPSFLNFPSDFRTTNNSEVIVAGSPFDQSTIVANHGRITNFKSERLLSPIIKRSLEIEGAHGEFGMSGGAVIEAVDNGFIFKGLLSHQVLVMKPGNPTRSDEWSKEDRFQNQLLSIDVVDVALQLQTYFSNPAAFKVSFYRDALGQINSSGGIVAHGLIFKPEVISNQIDSNKSFDVPLMRKSGGADPIGIGGVDKDDPFYTALSIEIFNGVEEFPTVIPKSFPQTYNETLAKVKRVLYNNQIVKIPYLVFQDTESVSLAMIKCRSISELFSLITDTRYLMVVKNISENNQIKIEALGNANIEYLKKISIDHLSLENRVHYSQIETISKLASANNLELVKCHFLQTLSTRNAEADIFWADMLNQNFDVSTKLLQNVKYFARLCN